MRGDERALCREAMCRPGAMGPTRTGSLLRKPPLLSIDCFLLEKVLKRDAVPKKKFAA